MRRLLLATLLAFLAIAPASQAARVTYAEAPDKLRVYDDSNDVNDLRVTQDGLTFTISDAQPLTEDSVRCVADVAGVVTCTAPAGVKEIEVYAGGGDDGVRLSTTLAAVVHGEGGADALTGGAGADELHGDLDPDPLSLRTNVGVPGSDTLIGNGGSDRFVAGVGDDVVKAEDGVGETVDCGEGTDTGNADRADTLVACEPGVVQPAEPTPVAAGPKTDNGLHLGRDGEVPAGPKVAVPVPGKSVAATVKRGVIYVRRPGTSKAVPLDPSLPIPVGSTLDATKGTLTLTQAVAGARAAQAGAATTQTADFTGAAFVVGQKAGTPGTELRMVGGDFSGCGAAASRTTARAAGNRKRVRRLWGSGHGRFTTRGKNSSATVRGTIWTVEDRCDGTLTRVTRGVVVVTDHRTKRTKVVRAGQSYLVRNAVARRR